MKARRKVTANPTAEQLHRAAWDAYSLAARVRTLRDFLRAHESDAAEHADEALNWLTEAAEVAANDCQALGGKRPSINGVDLREDFEEQLSLAHADLALTARERARRKK